MSDKITVVVHTYNSENDIDDCIASAKLVSHSIVIVDMESQDKTAEKAQALQVPFKTFPHSNYVEPARAFGIGQAESDWVLILDADERVTPELAKEILLAIETQNTSSVPNKIPTYYKIPRKNIFGKKKWLEYGGWWPDHQTRLINKTHFRGWPEEIHSTPIIEGAKGYLKKPMLHYFHGDLEKMVYKTTIFEDIESELLFKANKPANTLIFFRKFLGELNRRMFKSKGYKDGTVGIIESSYQAFSKTITYLFLYEKRLRSTEKKNSNTV